MYKNDAYESIIRTILEVRGRSMKKRHLDIARVHALNFMRNQIAPLNNHIILQVAQRLFSPSQTDYISPKLLSEFDRNDILFSELAEETQINTQNLAGKGMHKMRSLNIEEVSDIEYVSAKEIMAVVNEEDFLTECFRKIFRRDPDRPGFDHYLYVLHSGYMNRRQVISDMWHSDEGMRQAIVVFDQISTSSEATVSTEAIKSPVNLPIVIDRNPVNLPGFGVYVKRSEDGIIFAEKDEYILHGPKCIIEKGNYFIDLDLEVLEGVFSIEATSFAGTIRLFEFPIRNKIKGEFGFRIDIPMDLFEIRLIACGTGNRVKLNQIMISGEKIY